jgi:hypothetical protein
MREMTRSIALRGRQVALVTLAWLAPSALQAQRIELQILGGAVSDESGTVGRGLTISPAVAWSATGRWLRLEGRGTALQGGGSLLGGGAGFYLGREVAGPVALEASGSAGLLAADGGFRSVTGEINPGARVGAGAASVGAGVGLRGVSLTSSPAAWRQTLPFAGSNERTGVARSLWAEGRTGVGALSLVVTGRTSRSDDRAWHEAQAGASVALGRATVSGFAGARFGDVEGQWGGAAASLRIAPGVELLAQLARHATDPLTGQPGARTATVGLSLSHGGAGSASPNRAPRPVRVSLSAASAARVELLADWNDWRPEPLTHHGGGVFAREVRLPPGIYHFVFRVNGELRLPEGYETAPDEFGGKSAVLRVRG